MESMQPPPGNATARCAVYALPVVVSLISLGTTAEAEQSALTPAAHFVRRVLPVLKAKCFACHGDQKEIRGEYTMLSRTHLLAGGESGERAVIPGDAEASPLFRAVLWDDLEMPPKQSDRLSLQQIEAIRRWIDDGAVWPSAKEIEAINDSSEDAWDEGDGVRVQTSGGLSPEWTQRRYAKENLWAYQPLRRFDRNATVDRFIDRKLKAKGITPAPVADRRTLIRRATYDLTGLPPTPKQIRGFLNDKSDDRTAFAALVERLLASPHYGEHWARHWLDVVRYADSSGYANDFERGTTWRYRDYVVRALNSDKPYDEFIREQIAGDEIDSSNPELLIAAGFLRMGPWELTGMEVAKVARQRFLDDVTDAVGQVFLGHMLQCARCHDHKFDPVPTRDYYSMQAVFATTQLAQRTASFLPEENTKGFDERKVLLERKRIYSELLARVNEKETLSAAREWFIRENVDAQPFEDVVRELTLAGEAPRLPQVRAEMARRKIEPAFIPPKKSGFEPQDFGLERIGRKEQQRLTWRLKRYEPVAFSVYSGKTPRYRNVSAPLKLPSQPTENGELESTAILTGGDPFSPSEPVSPSALSAIGFDANCPPGISGRRRQLAAWITDAKNPLTARVMVNRIWQWHFGQAIAGNPNNFGTTGKKPTHPELLDWLANQFMAHNWSIKSMHRLIMNSEAYRRGSSHPDPARLGELDADNTSYARFTPRRLTAEELRDSMLACSGELNREIGGVPVRPEISLEAALQPRMVMGTFAESWQPSPLPSQRHRRSLYALRLRGLRDPFQDVFNSPSADTSCEARSNSMVTPQVFALFNSEITYDRAIALANRVYRKRRPRLDVIRRLFATIYGRPATESELVGCLKHWKKMEQRHQTLVFQKPEYPTKVTREAVEENTGVRFTYTEPLESYREFVPDLKAADVGPVVRGLAEVCLVLFNSNEFAYVY